MRHRRPLLVAVLLLGGGALLGLLLARPWMARPDPEAGSTPGPDPKPGVQEPEPQEPPPLAEERPVPLEPGLLRKAATPETKGWIAYPDGSALPPLNGVPALDRPLLWPPDRNFAPVVGKLRLASGEEWYLHENGLRSTTIFWDVTDAQGRTSRQGIGLVMSPEVPMPTPVTGR